MGVSLIETSVAIADKQVCKSTLAVDSRLGLQNMRAVIALEHLLEAKEIYRAEGISRKRLLPPASGMLPRASDGLGDYLG